MSTTKTKEELTRLAWIAALRQQGERQCIGPSHGKNGVCALVLLSEIVGDRASPRTVALSIGLSEEQCDEVIFMNDGHGYGARAREKFKRRTFSEIADVVAGWFPE